MKVILCDIDPAVVQAWKVQFERHPTIEILERSILEIEVDALVNPGNSFGFMDGGLALLLSERFGFALEDSVRQAIRERFGGEMLVGQADVFPTGGRPPYLVYAPIVRTPRPIDGTMNPYLVTRAAFRAVEAFNRAEGTERIRSIAFPGLGTGKGKVPPLVSARQLRYAYKEAFGLRKVPDQNLSRLIRRERKLLEMPKSGEVEEE